MDNCQHTYNIKMTFIRVEMYILAKARFSATNNL